MIMASRSLELPGPAVRSPFALTMVYATILIRALQSALMAPSPGIAEYPVLYMTEWK